jgi:site-specific recombinase XerD
VQLLVILFTVDTGCRAGGIVSLTWDNVDLRRCRAYVVEKGKRRRVVFFSSETQLALRQLRVGVQDDKRHVFCSLTTGNPLTESGLYQLFERIALKAGVSSPTNPHAYRHAFGVSFMEGGGDSLVLAKLMGHKDVHVTASYYAIFGLESLARQYAQHAPMLKIRKAKRSSE